ncbi:MAG: type II and III secretion system protein [Acidobacteriaceae bacterium]
MNGKCSLAVVAVALTLLAGNVSAQQAKPAKSSAPLMSSPASAPPGKPVPRVTVAGTEAKKPSQRKRNEAIEAFLAGARAFEQNRLTVAEDQFVRAQKLDPGNPTYVRSAEIARQSMVTQLIDRRGKAGHGGNNAGDRSAIKEAMDLDPGNPLVAQYLHGSAVDSSAERPAIRTDNDNGNAPIRLAPERFFRNFHLRMNERELIPQVLSAYGIQATVDDSIVSRIVPFDATDLDFRDALRILQLATATFMVPLDPHRVLALADTRQNRSKFQPLIVETISFPGLNNMELSEMENVARNVLGIEHAVMHSTQGTITFRAPEPELTALNEIYRELVSDRSEVQLDVHVYEIDRSKETNAGMILPNSAMPFNVHSEADSILANNAALVQEIVSSGEAVAGAWQKIIAILIASGALSGTVFNNAFAVFGGGLTETGAEWNTTAANMLLSTSDVKSLNEIQLRVTDQEEATFQVGERYPITTSTYSVLSGVADSSAQTTPQIQYTDLGLTLKARPYVEGSGDITLRLDVMLDSLAGSSINDIPILTNRQYSAVVSVRPGNSALLVSAISEQDSQELTGVPGLSEIPGFEDATNRQSTTNTMELVILVTPHVVRTGHLQTADPVMLTPRSH